MGQDCQANVGFYYGLFCGAPWYVIGSPPCIALFFYIISYYCLYIKHTARLRTKALIKTQSSWLKWITVVLLLLLLPVVI